MKFKVILHNSQPFRNFFVWLLPWSRRSRTPWYRQGHLGMVTPESDLDVLQMKVPLYRLRNESLDFSRDSHDNEYCAIGRSLQDERGVKIIFPSKRWLSNILITFLITCGGVAATRSRSIHWTLTLKDEEVGGDPTRALPLRLLSCSKAIYPHCCSRPRCINGVHGRSLTDLSCLKSASAIIELLYQARNASLDGVHCISASLKCIPWPA